MLRMMSDQPIEDAIRDAAPQPAEISADGVTVKQRPIGEQIAADRYLKSVDAAQKPNRGMRLTRLIPPGAT